MDFVITIGREYGSGGREVGQKLAEYYDIPLYDKLLVDKISECSKLSKEYVKKMDENYQQQLSSYIFGRYYNYIAMPDPNSIETIVNNARVETIQQLALDPCVIVGRAADYILEKNENAINFFIVSNEIDKIGRIINRNTDIPDEKEARRRIKQVDKNRKKYYEFNTDKNWGAAKSYDLTLNTSIIGIDGAVQTIIDFLDKLEERRTL